MHSSLHAMSAVGTSRKCGHLRVMSAYRFTADSGTPAHISEFISQASVMKVECAEVDASGGPHRPVVSVRTRNQSGRGEMDGVEVVGCELS